MSAQVEVQVFLRRVEEDQRVHFSRGTFHSMSDPLIVGVWRGEVHVIPLVQGRKLGGERLQDICFQPQILLLQKQVEPGPPHVVRGDRVVIAQHVGAVSQKACGVGEPGKLPVQDGLGYVKEKASAQFFAFDKFPHGEITSFLVVSA